MADQQELLILGLLKEGPKHGYEIKAVRKQIMEAFAGSERESIYYPLKMMERRGLVSKQITRVGRRPQRHTYSITPAGERRFSELLGKSLVTIDRPRFGIDASLYFSPYLNQDELKKRLEVRLRILKKIQAAMKQLRATQAVVSRPHHHAIVEHNIELMDAEIKFLTGFIANRKHFR